ncbi:hypothetical protein OHV05_18225 [Kitasatospora sp. NBC_00070]|uniref:hypothetical protein n=1 Tax=Kitasatospora sp. NBC_00070 TaxID=2975962 RepID=UPI00324FF092
MTPSWTEPGHPDVELLADLAEDLVDPAEVPLLRAHLTDCAECADTWAALAEVGELLGAVEDFPPLPAEFADRIDAALAVEAAAPVTPAADPLGTAPPLSHRPAGPGRRLHRRGRVLLATAACLAVLGLGGTLLGHQGTTSGGGTGTTDAAARPAAAGARVFTDDAELAGQIQLLLRDGSTPAKTTDAPHKEPSLGAGAAPESGTVAGAGSGATAPCPATAPGTPLLATPGRFGPDQVTALVYPLDGDRLDVYLVTADCRVRLHRTVPAG